MGWKKGGWIVLTTYVEIMLKFGNWELWLQNSLEFAVLPLPSSSSLSHQSHTPQSCTPLLSKLCLPKNSWNLHSSSYSQHMYHQVKEVSTWQARTWWCVRASRRKCFHWAHHTGHSGTKSVSCCCACSPCTEFQWLPRQSISFEGWTIQKVLPGCHPSGVACSNQGLTSCSQPVQSRVHGVGVGPRCNHGGGCQKCSEKYQWHRRWE